VTENPHPKASTQAQVTYGAGLAVQLDVLDHHDFRLKITGSGCRQMESVLDYGRQLQLQSESCPSNGLLRQ
jgi:hypothetical protein